MPSPKATGPYTLQPAPALWGSPARGTWATSVYRGHAELVELLEGKVK